MRYFIELTYDGTAYHGWQVQPNASSVQETLNKALSLLLRTDVEVTGAGRTDTGVHAAQMMAHFDFPSPVAGEASAQGEKTSAAEGKTTRPEIEIFSVEKKTFAEELSPLSEAGRSAIPDVALLSHKLNRLLPPDISITRIYPVPAEAHARFSAVARTYHYSVYTGKHPFFRHYAARLHFEPDYALMNVAAARLLEVSDFTSFSKLHTDVKTNICRVTQARWVQVDGDLWRFEITADRFLRNMVRAIVGTLLEVGRGRLTVEGFADIVARKSRQAAGESAPANALSLVRIDYPASILIFRR